MHGAARNLPVNVGDEESLARPDEGAGTSRPPLFSSPADESPGRRIASPGVVPLRLLLRLAAVQRHDLALLGRILHGGGRGRRAGRAPPSGTLRVGPLAQRDGTLRVAVAGRHEVAVL